MRDSAAITGILLGSAIMAACVAVKPIAKTVDSIATDACVQHFGEVSGLSLEEAAEKFCSTKKQIQPFLDALLAAKQTAGTGVSK